MIKYEYEAHAYCCGFLGGIDFPNIDYPDADIPGIIANLVAHRDVILKNVNQSIGVVPYPAVWYVKYKRTSKTEDRPIDEFCGEEGFKVRFKDGEYYAHVNHSETNVFTLDISDTVINVSNLIATDNHEPVDLTGATLTVEGFTYSAMNHAYVKSVQQGEYTDGQVISVNVTVTKGDYSGVAVLTCTVNA